MTRENVRAKRREAWHQSQVDSADTPRKRLWKACGWLVAESWRRGRIDDATERVLTTIHEFREEDRHVDSDYAA